MTGCGGVLLGLWGVMSIGVDGLILWTTVVLADRPLEGPLLALTFLNPVDLARVLLTLRLDISAMMGYTGAVLRRRCWTGTLAAVCGLAAWALLPGLLLRAFKRRDF